MWEWCCTIILYHNRVCMHSFHYILMISQTIREIMLYLYPNSDCSFENAIFLLFSCTYSRGRGQYLLWGVVSPTNVHILQDGNIIFHAGTYFNSEISVLWCFG